jgi:hypothetical protein
MNVVPKRLRHKLYVLALEIYLHDEDALIAGICYCLAVANRILGNVVRPDDIYDHIEIFPEINKYKPKTRSDYWNNTNYWWNTKDREVRIRVLVEAIELSKRISNE